MTNSFYTDFCGQEDFFYKGAIESGFTIHPEIADMISISLENYGWKNPEARVIEKDGSFLIIHSDDDLALGFEITIYAGDIAGLRNFISGIYDDKKYIDFTDYITGLNPLATYRNMFSLVRYAVRAMPCNYLIAYPADERRASAYRALKKLGFYLVETVDEDGDDESYYIYQVKYK